MVRRRSIKAGGFHTCGINEDGQLVCFGAKEDNVDYGQALQVPNGNYVGLDSGLYHNCAITPDSEVYCWGAGKTIGVEPHYGHLWFRCC